MLIIEIFVFCRECKRSCLFSLAPNASNMRLRFSIDAHLRRVTSHRLCASARALVRQLGKYRRQMARAQSRRHVER